MTQIKLLFLPSVKILTNWDVRDFLFSESEIIRYNNQ